MSAFIYTININKPIENVLISPRYGTRKAVGILKKVVPKATNTMPWQAGQIPAAKAAIPPPVVPITALD